VFCFNTHTCDLLTPTGLSQLNKGVNPRRPQRKPHEFSTSFLHPREAYMNVRVCTFHPRHTTIKASFLDKNIYIGL